MHLTDHVPSSFGSRTKLYAAALSVNIQPTRGVPLWRVLRGARAAERMARYRQRRQSGMRCLMIELRREEVAWLVRHRWLASESRSDLNAVKRALYAFLDASLRWPPT